MNNWPYRPLSDFLIEREGRFKPNDPKIASYKRLDKIDFSGKIHISEKPSKTDMIIIEPGDLVISGINVAKGALAVYDGNDPVTATIHYSSYRFKKNKIDIEFLKRFLKSPAFISELQDQVKGGIKTEIKPKHLLPLKARIPELAEQQKINHYFDAIDKEISDLSNEVNTQSSYLMKLRQAILQEAIEGKLTADLPCRQAGWRNKNFRNFSGKIVPQESEKYFTYVLECNDGSLYKGFSKDLFSRIDRHLEGRGAEWTEKHQPVSLIHFDEFKTEKEAVEREKYFKSGSGREWLNSIRDQKKLDFDAEALLEKIQAEKEKLIKEGKIKKQKPLAPIKAEEVPFELPEGWVWTRLGNTIFYTDNLDIQKKLSPSTIINYVDIDSIDNKLHQIKEYKIKTVSELSSRARRVLKKGYIAYSTVRPYLENIAFIKNDIENGIGSTGLNVFKPIQNNPIYVFNFLLSPYINNKYKEMMIGFNSPSITNEQFENTCFPLPPLVEQQAIVDRLEKLLSMVDELEKQVSERKEQSEQLMQAVLREAFEGGK